MIFYGDKQNATNKPLGGVNLGAVLNKSESVSFLDSC